MGNTIKMKLKKFDGINVVPFIDIMLVLLVIVLTTASFIAKGEIPIELPRSSASAKQLDQKEVNIFITKENEIFINQEKIQNDQLDSKISSYDSKTLFKINCDKDAKYDYFVFVLDRFKALNLTNIAIVTQK